MRRVIVIAVAGASLAGCSSFSLDAFKPTPPTIQVQLESVPSGADARTSLGPGCKTPCSVAVPAPEGGFSVTYTLNKFQPATRPRAGGPYPRRFCFAGLDQHRSQPGGRGTSAGGPTAQGRGKDAEAEKAETGQGRGRARRIAIPGPGASAPAGHAQPLIACTAPDRHGL